MDDHNIDFDQVLQSDYLVFEVEMFTGKTYVVVVRSRRTGFALGKIQWWGAWRQYVFAPAYDTVFNVGCMDDIKLVITHLHHLRSLRKAST